MSLYLVETTVEKNGVTKEDLKAKINRVEEKLGDSAFIEVQIAKDLSQLFFIIETDHLENIAKVFEDHQLAVQLTKEVRLIGEDIEDVKKEKEKVNYVVEWNLPEHLTMEQYLERKKKNSVHYEEVPEVSFARTYVCEDMTKCLCFYDAPNQQAVERARDAVSAPIDAITELGDDE
ncbi:MAG TPA: DUF4242 domain-containing protein [Pseudogracilibacillus sp.]|nr:DUF4242 domain-containing protein [Pseudogracilibacillus sp.]